MVRRSGGHTVSHRPVLLVEKDGCREAQKGTGTSCANGPRLVCGGDHHWPDLYPQVHCTDARSRLYGCRERCYTDFPTENKSRSVRRSGGAHWHGTHADRDHGVVRLFESRVAEQYVYAHIQGAQRRV